MAKSISEWCQEQGLSIEQLIERSGLEENRVMAIAQGRWTPSPSERQKIAAVLNTAVDEITWGHKTPIQHIYGHGPG